MTDGGILGGKSATRQPAVDAWGGASSKLKSLLWKLADGLIRLPRPVTAEPRRKYVLQSDIEKFGPADGCPGRRVQRASARAPYSRDARVLAYREIEEVNH
eukprot:1851011-Amphidinium_carterae.2